MDPDPAYAPTITIRVTWRNLWPDALAACVFGAVFLWVATIAASHPANANRIVSVLFAVASPLMMIYSLLVWANLRVVLTDAVLTFQNEWGVSKTVAYRDVQSMDTEYRRGSRGVVTAFLRINYVLAGAVRALYIPESYLEPQRLKVIVDRVRERSQQTAQGPSPGSDY